MVTRQAVMARGRQIGAARNVHVRCGDFLGNVAVFCGQGAVDSASRTGLACENSAARAALGCQMGGSGETFGLVSGRRRFAWAIPEGELARHGLKNVKVGRCGINDFDISSR